MPLSVRVEPINRDIELLLDETFSPKAQSAAFAEFAGEQIDEAKETDRSILGRVPQYTVSVDGRIGASLDQVKPDGVIVAEFELFNDVLAWIADQLVTHSPVGGGGDKHPGLYQKSHVLFADGAEVEVGGVIPAASSYVFLNATPYARKIEKGSSSQAPDGVYQAVAILAARRFGNVAKIEFAYRALMSGPGGSGRGTSRFRHGSSARAMRRGIVSDQRSPAIIVTLGDR